jgi:transaldolase
MMLVATSSFALHFSGRAAATLKGGRSTVKMATDLKMPTPLTQLEQMATMTTLSIDTGDLDIIEAYGKGGLITDATTNPLFVAQAGLSGDKRYVAFVDSALAYAKENAEGPEAQLELSMDRLAVELGLEIVKLVPGYVSTEVDIRASFDTEESLRRARRIIAMYEAAGVDRSRILIKLAGTWEGIAAARILEKEGITCNITLIFGFIQAVAAGQAGARLVSPFPGRIKDWHAANGGEATYQPAEDPGVVCVARMHAYYKKYGHEKTICMPASWRPSRGTSDPTFAIDEIVALAGVDRMTIGPPLLELLAASSEPLERMLEPVAAAAACADELIGEGNISEADFRLALNADVCATTKMAEGINAFVGETLKLEASLRSKL